MSVTRNNHYVPRWYQNGFLEPGENTLAYLDLTPQVFSLRNGATATGRGLFRAQTARAFRHFDLYSTFLGNLVNDEIERRLFGDVDVRGSAAVRAFISRNGADQHRHFQTLFEYLDIQKLRTPKGLAWVRSQYPRLDQNDLMQEMQGLRMMHCTIWAEGVREIVSARNAATKFIISDHPVTIYNRDVPPDSTSFRYPNDPPIALKGSQTVFPLNRDFCLILTNLEYARDQSVDALSKRTFARHYRSSMVRTDAFIRVRELGDVAVEGINSIIRQRSHRYLAAGREEWLTPNKQESRTWKDLGAVLLPPQDELWLFGGEMYAGFTDGRTYFQDEFGRTEKKRDYLQKTIRSALRPGDSCGCGSGRNYRDCCRSRPTTLRPTWEERSIRERNLMFFNSICNVLRIDDDVDWVRVRRELTDEQIAQIYSLYAGLWPLETDLLELLPKPDGRPRSVYTGAIHYPAVTHAAFAIPLHFGPTIIQHPFVHPGTVKPDFSPVVHPSSYRHEFLKAATIFLAMMPLIDSGLINLVPDPCNFDPHLRDQMFRMATVRGDTSRDSSEG